MKTIVSTPSLDSFPQSKSMLERALKTVREVHQIPQSELAGRLGISKSHLSELESGRKNVTIEVLRRYADVFDVPPSTFLSFMEALEGESERRRSRAKKLLSVLEWTLEKDDGNEDEREEQTDL